MTKPHNPISNRYPDALSKEEYIQTLFNSGAPYYDQILQFGFLGSGNYYRKRVLKAAGLKPGMKVLDVACGTGAVTQAILEIIGTDGYVCGLDPSEGMLNQARKHIASEFIQGKAEDLPFEKNRFDFLTMGYALRHVEDLELTFREFRRVMRPGGRLLLLEIGCPQSRLGYGLAKSYFGCVLPFLSWVWTRSRAAKEMMDYYWETIEACVSPEVIQKALIESEYIDVQRHVELGIFNVYEARRPEMGLKSGN